MPKDNISNSKHKTMK